MRLIHVIGLAAVAVLAVGCGGSSSGDGTSAASDPGAIIDKTFTSTSVQEGGSDRPLVPGSSVAISFTADGISAQAGCNTQVGTASFTDGVITLEGQLASTMMACDQALMDQDQWVAAFLTSGPKWAVDGTTLTLTSPTITMTMSESAGS